MSNWDHIENRTTELRQQLLEHPVYARIHDIESVQQFMELHVYAVWDFMSLLKALQNECCCTTVPWTPPANPAVARLINEIVLAEETDEDENGRFASHFDLYLAAMQQAGANTATVEQFLSALSEGQSVPVAMTSAGVPEAAQAFVNQTFDIIDQGHLPSIAAAFTFGREDLLPDVFTQVVSGINKGSDSQLSKFAYYLDRHISLDGDEHGPMARQLVNTLCGENQENWQRAEQAVIASLESRMALWDAMEQSMNSSLQIAQW